MARQADGYTTASLSIRERDRLPFAEDEQRRTVMVTTPITQAQCKEITTRTQHTCNFTKSGNAFFVCPTFQKAHEVRDLCRSMGIPAKLALEST